MPNQKEQKVKLARNILTRKNDTVGIRMSKIDM